MADDMGRVEDGGELPLRTEACPVCPICGRAGPAMHEGVTDRAHAVPGVWSIRRCDVCGIGWLDPQAIDADIGRCYPKVYYTHASETVSVGAVVGGSGSGGRSGLKSRVREAILAGRYGYALPGSGGRAAAARLAGRTMGRVGALRQRVVYRQDDALPIWREGGRLLDIGCGSGAYLGLVTSLGWQAHGLDPDPVAADLARRTGAEVTVGTLDTVAVPGAPFDAVTSMHSIEHARDPRAFLREALRLLRPGGFFYLQTPNFDSLMHRRFGADWYALEISRHLCLLTVPALRRLLEELGSWERLTVRSIPRRAVREQEQTLAMRREGSFEARPAFSMADRARMRAWAVLEQAGNGVFRWGEEIEVIGISKTRPAGDRSTA